MADIRKLLRLSLASALLAAPVYAQLADPANLTGEHVSPQSPADTLPLNHGTLALQQLLLKLRTRASMLLVVAHPDDEDGGFLTYESRGQGARVGMLTLNRGEGGQNLMTSDFDDALGLIRTQELLAADRYMGVDQFFSTVADFGFSKTKEETLQKWTHERVLYDAVRVVRLYRPLIIASVFVGGPTDGHGQHQVSGEIAQEAFVAAADPKVFPEMGLPPWAPLKVYARTPFARVTNGTMHDYATGKDLPVLFHNYVTGLDINHAPAATVQIHEGEKSTLLGMNGDTYQQFARKGLALQKSQNGGFSRGPAPTPITAPGTTPPPPSPAPEAATRTADVAYTLMASRVYCPILTPGLGAVSLTDFHGVTPVCPSESSPSTEQSAFEGIDTSLRGVASLAPDAPVALRENLLQTLADLDRIFAAAAPEYATPERALNPLHTALTQLDSLLAAVQTTSFDATQKFNLQHELRIKRVQLNSAILLALGVTADSVVSSPSQVNLIPGQHFVIQTSLTTSATQPLHILSATLRIANPAGDASPTLVQAQPIGDRPLMSGTPLRLEFEDRLPLNTPLTRPPFHRASLEQAFYNVPDPALRDAPAAPYPMVAHIALRDGSGDVLEIDSAVAVENPDPALLRQPASIVPVLSVAVFPDAGILPLNDKSLHLSTRVTLGVPASSGTPSILANTASTLRVPEGWKVNAEPRSGASTTSLYENFAVDPGTLASGKTYRLTAVATENHHVYTETFLPIGYPGLTFTNYYTPATYKANAVDVHTAPNLRVAYLPGTGDDVPTFLANLGVTPSLISIKDLVPQKLAAYDEVILGVRAYAAHPELAGSGSKPLLDFAAAGGVVVVQYNNARYGGAEAPYPITTPQSSGDHAHDVVVEAQPVTVLQPSAPLLSWPNKITSADFRNWVAEFGHSFAGTWAPQYQALLEVHDPEQDPQEGSLLVAPVGKGAYIYCALALYRQLPEGVPGAYRLYANLLSYPKNPNR